MKKVVLLVLSILIFSQIASCSINSLGSTEEIINELSGAKYEGRLVGTMGNEKASHFLADTFKEYGIDPLFDSGYFQEYPQKVAVPSEQQPEIVITNADGTQYKLTYGEDYILNAAAEDLSVNMPLTFDTADKDIQESVAVIPIEQLGSLSDRCRIAIVSYPALRFAPSIPQPGDRIKIDVPEKVREKMMADKAKSVEIKLKAAVRDYTAKNVAAVIKGVDSSKAIVLTAHFDHVGKQGLRIFPGALDNASGTAALLSVAGRIRKALGGRKPDVDIVFACVNSEECSCLPVIFPGSAALVDKLSARYADLFNINIDCVGGKNAGPLAMGAIDEGTIELVNELCSCLRKNSVEFTMDKYEAGSDHQTFIEKGYGAIVIGQSGILPVTHIEGDMVETVECDTINRIAVSVSDFILAKGAEIFDSCENCKDSPKAFKSDDIEWMRRAYRERDSILGDRKLKYNEAMYYMYDGELLRTTGARPFTSMEEIEKYYADTSFPESILDHTFDNVDFRNSSLYDIAHTDDTKPMKGCELNQIFEIPTDIKDVFSIVLEYKNATNYLCIDISNSSNNSIYGTIKLVQEPLDHEYAGYVLNKWSHEDEYHSFSYLAGNWCIEVSAYEKMEFPDLYDESKTTMIADPKTKLKTKEEMLALIDALDIKGKADALISNAGLPK